MDTSTNAVSRQLPRDVFLYLLMIFALGAGAISLGTLLFQFINIYVPDVAAQACYYDSCHQAIRTALAFLIIVFPVLIWVLRFLRRDVAAYPEKREMRIRRWLLYLTLFVAGLIVIGDLIALVNGYLQGELTLRFILKVGAVALIAGSIFYVFLKDLRGEMTRNLRIVQVKIVVIVVAAIVAGLVIAGSPTRQRDRRLDDQRINDLSVLQSQIVDRFWRSKSRLPGTLSELQDDISGFSVPVDPETGDPYGYERLGVLDFRLCAVFALPTDVAGNNTYPRGVWPGDSWEHDAGEFCFDRTIDPDLYKPLQEVPAVR
ncbi:MAG TPA: DUF5671 domain-containing protein [Candidatus Paceibacterota bacterium]|nr:DUF5671 domain-containing protein [Candidatus Paceibacterota bacterium]